MGNPAGFQSWVCWVWVWVSLLYLPQTHTHLVGLGGFGFHGFGVVFGSFLVALLSPQTLSLNFFTPQTFSTITNLHPMAPAQSTLKRTQADTTVNQIHPKSNIPHKTPKLAQLQADKNQQEQRSVDKVHNSRSGSVKHLPMHQSPAANKRDDLEILEMVNKDRVAPCEDVYEDMMQLSKPAETAEDERSE